MSWWKRLIIRLRRWKRIRAHKKLLSGTLREFVYLDEVSVYSLIASRRGSIAAQYTETETKSLQSEIGSTLGGGVGSTRAELRSRLAWTETQQSQVLRKATVQSTFKEFYDVEAEQLAARPIDEEVEPPKVRDLDDLKIGGAARENLLPWVLGPQSFSRGTLVEFEIELEAEAVFAVNAVVSAMLALTEQNEEFLGLANDGSLQQAQAIGRILDQLLDGLVPIRGRMLDYSAVVIEGEELLIHRSLAETMPEELLPNLRPAYVVGVASQSSFWKDLRRVLFSGLRFRALCRVAADGLQPSWTPVKLSQVLRAVVPEVGDALDRLTAVLKRVGAAPQHESLIETKRVAYRAALLAYVTHFSNEPDLETLEKTLEERGVFDSECIDACGTDGGIRKALAKINEYLELRLGQKPDPGESIKVRREVFADARDFIDSVELDRRSANPQMTAVESGPFLDTEFIAIYW